MRHVLIVTGGQAPAVVTETVWALDRQRDPPFRPDKLVVVVTASVRPLYESRLRGPDGKLALLSRELGRSNLDAVTEIVATDCPDIRSEAEAIAFGDKVCEVVQRETSDAACLVHLSLAGGRKTMSFHGGAALTLFGRPQDELSHVLVHPAELESAHADFWWPDHNKPGRVELALIPFVRVRRRLPDPMLERPMRYADYVAQVNAAIEGRAGVVLELLVDCCRLRVAGVSEPIRLEPQHFNFYRVLAEWTKAQVPGCGAGGLRPDAAGWISTRMLEDAAAHPHSTQNPVARMIELMPELADRITPLPTNDKQRRQNLEHLRPIVSHLRTTLWDAVTDVDLGLRLISPPTGGRQASNPPRTGITLAPEEISIRASDGGPELPPLVRIMQYRVQ